MPSTRFGGREYFVRRENPLFLGIHPSPGPMQQAQAVEPQRPHRTEQLATAESAENNSATKKAAKRKNMYETFPHKEEHYLVNK